MGVDVAVGTGWMMVTTIRLSQMVKTRFFPQAGWLALRAQP